MPIAPVNGTELYYESHGEGPAIVFAHGRGGNHLSWWQQVPVFAKSYHCITFDHRGFGQSTMVPLGPDGRRQSFIDDLKALLDHLEIEKTFLVAQSMGGLACLGFALAYPQRTRGLVLADTTGGVGDGSVAKLIQEYQAPTGTLARVVAKSFIENHPVRTFLYMQISALNPTIPPEPVSPFASGEGPKGDELARIKFPTLVIVGQEDAIFPVHIMKAVHALIPGARLEIVPDAGHSVYFEHPEIFNRLVSEHLEEALLPAAGRAG